MNEKISKTDRAAIRVGRQRQRFLRVAKWHRTLLGTLVVQLLLLGGLLTFAMLDSAAPGERLSAADIERSQFVLLCISVVLALLGLMQVVALAKLSAALNDSGGMVFLFILLAFVPVASILVILLTASRGRRELEGAGLRVRAFGVSPREVARVARLGKQKEAEIDRD